MDVGAHVNIARVAKVEADTAWLGVQKNSTQSQHINCVRTVRQVQGSNKRSRYVRVKLGGHRMKLYCDTGCKMTIIPPEM